MATSTHDDPEINPGPPTARRRADPGDRPGAERHGVRGARGVAPGAYVVEAGVIRPRGAALKTFESRLLALHNGVLEVLDAFPPVAMAMEQVHSHPGTPGRRS